MNKRERKNRRRRMLRERKHLYAWFSAKQARACGSCLYRRIDGRIVEVTEVREVPRPCCWRWADLKSRGKVTKCVRVNRMIAVMMA